MQVTGIYIQRRIDPGVQLAWSLRQAVADQLLAFIYSKAYRPWRTADLVPPPSCGGTATAIYIFRGVSTLAYSWPGPPAKLWRISY